MRLRPYTAIALGLAFGFASVDDVPARPARHHVRRKAPPRPEQPPPAPLAQPTARPEPPANEPWSSARPQSAPPPQSPETRPSQSPEAKREPAIGFYETSEKYLRAPVTTLMPGDPPPRPPIVSPVKDDPEAVQRGMTYFNSFNCVGCHAPNGGGGMGPALSNRAFIYGGEPVNIFLSIYHGRPNGMPAWGATLSDNIIWDLVAYVESISNAPTSGWGQTISRDALKIQQTPAEFNQTVTPWNFTQRFSFGRKPSGGAP